jgi:hypothetical protein
MKPNQSVIVVAVLVACGTASPPAITTPTPPPVASDASQGISQDDDRATAITIIRDMESNPLAADETRTAARAWLLAWLSNNHDLTVFACPDLLGPGDHKDYVHVDVLLVLTIVGEARFLLEHPGASPESEAVFLAGMTSALVGYRNILTIEPKSHWSNFDELLDLQDHQRLGSHISHAMTSCTAKR